MDQQTEGKAMPREVSDVLLKLSQNKHFDQLHSLLKEIYHAESAESQDGAQGMKDHFKLILLSLGESLYSGRGMGTRTFQTSEIRSEDDKQ